MELGIKTVVNKFLPFKGFVAMTVWPFIFIRKDKELKFVDKAKRHEYIHVYQQIECLLVGVVLAFLMLITGCGWWSLIPLGLFFELYAIEWIIKGLINFGNSRKAYRSISFEREAFENQENPDWLDDRPKFYWIKYVLTSL